MNTTVYSGGREGGGKRGWLRGTGINPTVGEELFQFAGFRSASRQNTSRRYAQVLSR